MAHVTGRNTSRTRSTRLRGVLLTVLAAAALAAGPARAAIIDFNFSLAGATVAHGSFSYADSLVGVLGYSDLDAFDVTFPVSPDFGGPDVVFGLAQLDPTAASSWFSYDTVNRQLIEGCLPDGLEGGCIPVVLAGSDSLGNATFAVIPGDPGVYLAINDANSAIGNYDSFSLSERSADVPEPGTLALLGVGLLGLGFARRYARYCTPGSTHNIS